VGPSGRRPPAWSGLHCYNMQAKNCPPPAAEQGRPDEGALMGPSEAHAHMAECLQGLLEVQLLTRVHSAVPRRMWRASLAQGDGTQAAHSHSFTPFAPVYLHPECSTDLSTDWS
jgi:hypothetical protein